MAQLRRCCGVRFDPRDTPMWARIKWGGSVLILFAGPLAGSLPVQVAGMGAVRAIHFSGWARGSKPNFS